MKRFIEQILKKLDLQDKLNDENIEKLSKSLNYDKNELLKVAQIIEEKKRLQVKFWINNKNGSVFGKGSLELILLVDKIGSIVGAAKVLGYSYTKARNKIHQVEEELGTTIFIKNKGAGRQGGTKLNETGKKLLQHCIAFEEKLNEDAIKHYNTYLKEFFNKELR